MPKRLMTVCLTLFLLASTGCANKKKPLETEQIPDHGGTSASAAGGTHRNSPKNRVIRTALQEWDFFGKQTVRLDGIDESIPHVGKWEDDGDPWSTRVNWYWTAVGKPSLDGFDCKEPWSAAFISWVMRQAGLNSVQFPPADAHWSYIRHFVDHSGQTGTAFAPHPINQYSPRPGDLICATRGTGGFIPVYQMDPGSVLDNHTKLHCDIVVEQKGNLLASIGGNVRNSVSKTILTLDQNGYLKPSERRPWFVVLENRLP